MKKYIRRPGIALIAAMADDAPGRRFIIRHVWDFKNHNERNDP